MTLRATFPSHQLPITSCMCVLSNTASRNILNLMMLLDTSYASHLSDIWYVYGVIKLTKAATLSTKRRRREEKKTLNSNMKLKLTQPASSVWQNYLIYLPKNFRLHISSYVIQLVKKIVKLIWKRKKTFSINTCALFRQCASYRWAAKALNNFRQFCTYANFLYFNLYEYIYYHGR